jgi:hypothetical protein
MEELIKCFECKTELYKEYDSFTLMLAPKWFYIGDKPYCQKCYKEAKNVIIAKSDNSL